MLQAPSESELTEVSTAAETEGRGGPRGGKQGVIGFCSSGVGVFIEWSEMVSWRCAKMMRRDDLGEIWGTEVHAAGTSKGHEAETNFFLGAVGEEESGRRSGTSHLLCPLSGKLFPQITAAAYAH